MAENDIRELNLNVYLGFDSQSLPLLAGIPDLDGLSILVASSTDISIIEDLGDLRGLTIGGHTSLYLDFLRLPRLERAALAWSEGLSSILSCSSLKSIFLNDYNQPAIEGFKSTQVPEVGRLSHFIQPLLNGGILIASPNRQYGETSPRKNGAIYNELGSAELRTELGCGIQHI